VLLKLKPIVAKEIYVDIFRIDNVAILPVLDKGVMLLIIADPSIEVSRTGRDLNSCALMRLGREDDEAIDGDANIRVYVWWRGDERKRGFLGFLTDLGILKEKKILPNHLCASHN